MVGVACSISYDLFYCDGSELVVDIVMTATPGRLVDHLENTKGFHLRTLKYLVMDEADRILNMDFETEVSCLVAEEEQC